MSLKKTIKNTIITIGASIGAMYITNKVIEYSVTNSLLTDSEGTFYEWSNGRVYYTVEGEGKPLLLLHNLSATGSSYEWAYIKEALAQNRKVYTLDLPGCGRSEKPSQAYVSFYYVQLLQAFIKDVIGEDTDVIASANTCPISIAAAGFDNNMISSLYLINPLIGSADEEDSNILVKCLSRILQIPIVGTFVYNILICRRNLEKNLAEDFFFNPYDVDDEVIDAFYESGHLNQSKGRFLMASQLSGMMITDTEYILSKLEIPVYIILGDEEKIDRSITDAYLKISEDISVAEIPETGLLPQLEDPMAFLQSLLVLMDTNNIVKDIEKSSDSIEDTVVEDDDNCEFADWEDEEENYEDLCREDEEENYEDLCREDEEESCEDLCKEDGVDLHEIKDADGVDD